MFHQIRILLGRLDLSENFFLWISTLLFLPISFFLRFVHGTWLVLDKDYPSFRLTVGFLGSVFLIWLCYKWFFNKHVSLTKLAAPIAIFFSIMVLSTIFSTNPSLSLEKLVGVAGYLLTFFLLLDVKNNHHLWQGLINSILITSILSSLLILSGLTSWWELYKHTPSTLFQDPIYVIKSIPRLPLGYNLHPSVTAGYLVLILPLNYYRFFNKNFSLWKIILGIGFLINISTLIFTQSRGGLLGLGLIFITILIIYRDKIWQILAGSKSNNLIIVILSILVLIAGAFILLETRGLNISETSISKRLHAWIISFEILKNHPWLGSGLGTFATQHLLHRDPQIVYHTYIHAHNQLIQILAVTGIFGLGSFLFLMMRTIKLISNNPDYRNGSFHTPIIALAGLAGVLLPDAIFTSSMIVILFLFYMVWLLPQQDQSQRFSSPVPLVMLTLLAAGVCLGGGWITWKIQPYHQALQAAGKQHWPEAAALLDEAKQRDPGNPYYDHALGYAAGQASCQHGSTVDQAVEAYRRSLEQYPNWGPDRANLAVLFAKQGNYPGAVREMEQAVIYDPQQALHACLLGDYHLKLGNIPRAVNSYAQCLAEEPSLLDTPYWKSDHPRLQLLEEAVSLSKANLQNAGDARSTLQLVQLYQAAGDEQASRKLIQQFHQQFPDHPKGNMIFSLELAGSGDLDQAAEISERLVRTYPRVGQFWIARAEIARLSGQSELYEQALQISFDLQPTPPTAWKLAHHYLDQEDLTTADGFIFYALNSYRQNSDFAHDIAARWPLPGKYLNCKPQNLTFAGYYLPALEAAEKLAELDCVRAAELYCLLDQVNPGLASPLHELQELPCFETLSDSSCSSNPPAK